MKSAVFELIVDDAHGWVKVPMALVDSLDIAVTPFSYRHDEFAYLEEDCDLNTFAQAYRRRFGADARFVENVVPGASEIRNFARFERRVAP